MQFVFGIEEERFDTFVRTHPTKSHFMQSVGWAELCRAERGMTPHFVGMEEDGVLVAAALLLEKKPTAFPLYFYSPRGFVLDYQNIPLLCAFSQEVFSYCKRRGAMFLKIDPDVLCVSAEPGGAPQKADGADAVLAAFSALGFRHRGFNGGFENRQPRNTYRIDLRPDEALIKKRMTGSVLKNVRKSDRYAHAIEEGDESDLPAFCRLMQKTGERDHFYGFSDGYYQSFFRILKEHGMVRLYLGKLFPRRIAEDLLREKEALLQKKTTVKKEGRLREIEDSLERIERDRTRFSEAVNIHGDEAVISAHMVVQYGTHAWAVHAASADEMRETFLNNRVYFEKIFDQKKRGALWIDQFGTVLDPDADEKLQTLDAFKRQFGGSRLSFIGEFDRVFRPIPYFLYEQAVPAYRSALFFARSLRRKRNKGHSTD